MPRPLSDAKRKAILTDVRAGTDSCRGIAAKHGVSRTAVSDLAKANGIEDAFGRQQTKKATEAAIADHKARLAELASRSARLAERALHSFETMTDEEWRKTSFHSRGIVFGIAADKARELAPDDSGAGPVASLLGDLLGGLKAKHGDAPPE